MYIKMLQHIFKYHSNKIYKIIISFLKMLFFTIILALFLYNNKTIIHHYLKDTINYKIKFPDEACDYKPIGDMGTNQEVSVSGVAQNHPMYIELKGGFRGEMKDTDIYSHSNNNCVYLLSISQDIKTNPNFNDIETQKKWLRESTNLTKDLIEETSFSFLDKTKKSISDKLAFFYLYIIFILISLFFIINNFYKIKSIIKNFEKDNFIKERLSFLLIEKNKNLLLKNNQNNQRTKNKIL